MSGKYRRGRRETKNRLPQRPRAIRFCSAASPKHEFFGHSAIRGQCGSQFAFHGVFSSSYPRFFYTHSIIAGDADSHPVGRNPKLEEKPTRRDGCSDRGIPLGRLMIILFSSPHSYLFAPPIRSLVHPYTASSPAGELPRLGKIFAGFSKIWKSARRGGKITRVAGPA